MIHHGHIVHLNRLAVLVGRPPDYVATWLRLGFPFAGEAHVT